jgi:hypothetical protein
MFQKMTKIKDIFTARKFFLKKSLNISQTECQNFGLIPTHPGCGEISPNRITLLCSWFAVENEHRWRSVGPKTWSSFGIPNFYKWSLVEKKVVFFFLILPLSELFLNLKLILTGNFSMDVAWAKSYVNKFNVALTASSVCHTYTYNSKDRIFI